MTIHYKLTYWESVQCQLLRQRYLIQTRPWIFLPTYALIGLVFAAFMVFNINECLKVWHTIGYTPKAGDYGMLFFPLVAIFIGASIGILGSNLFLRSRQSVGIEPQGAQIKGGLRPLSLSWEQVSAVEEDGPFIVIAAGGNMNGFATLIPKRAFATLQEGEAFFDQAKAYWRDATGAQPIEELSAWPPAPKQREESAP